VHNRVARRRDAGPYPHRRANKAILAAQTVEWAALHYSEGLSIRQIAQQTGVSKSTVHPSGAALLYTHPSVRRCPACGRALCGSSLPDRMAASAAALTV
jgi:hypothetical protein